jgi:hypothetical protein
MGSSSQTIEVPIETPVSAWSLSSRIAFRFCVLYFSLFCASTQILGGLLPIPIDNVNIPDLSTPLRPLVFWTAAHIFQVKSALVFEGSGSGDKTFDWVLSFCLLFIAALGTALWSWLDRERWDYEKLSRWFRIFLRFAVAGQMLAYGFVKAVPLQMPFPYLTRLLEPYGNFSPMGVLWASVGASPSYETFIGSVEVLTGLLLIVPRTTMLGALLCLVDSIQIFALNMTYDVPVKLFSFHLILMSLLLLAPDLRRLADFLLLNRTVPPSLLVRASRRALIYQTLLGLWLIGNNAYGAWQGWHQYGGGRAKSPLYGIWDVSEMSVDNQVRSPLLTDYGRWRRAIFDFPERMSFQRMDGSFASYGIKADEKALALTKNDDKKWKASFACERKAPDQMTLDGSMDGHNVHMLLKLLDKNKFLLVSRGFHWVQEYPFNR